jgi:transposase
MRKEPVMSKVCFVGLDVHAETIAVAVAEAGGEVRRVGRIPHRPEALRQVLRKLGRLDQLRCCYEAGPTGYGVYWQLAEWGVPCEVIAPTLVPIRAGDRVKTDHRDAEKLARAYRAGDLTAVWVPDRASEALRDLVRAREVAKRDQLRVRHRFTRFLLRQGLRPPTGVRVWTARYRDWATTIRFDHPAQEHTRLDYWHEVQHAAERIARLEQALDDVVATASPAMRASIEALQALRGVARVSAVSVVTEVGRLSRFRTPRQLMGYSGLVASERSSGTRRRQGAITKTGNAHLRRIVVEAAWAYRHRPAIGPTLRRRQVAASPSVREIAWKAQHRLYKRYQRLTARGKPQPQVATAVARELLGFIWAIGVQAEREHDQTVAA